MFDRGATIAFGEYCMQVISRYNEVAERPFHKSNRRYTMSATIMYKWENDVSFQECVDYLLGV